jgi:hypothetical protein
MTQPLRPPAATAPDPRDVVRSGASAAGLRCASAAVASLTASAVVASLTASAVVASLTASAVVASLTASAVVARAQARPPARRPRLRAGVVLFAMLVAVCIFAPPRRARAQAPAPSGLPQRNAHFRWEKTARGNELLKVGFTARDLIDASVTQKLGSGVTSVIATRAYVFVDGQSDPIALAVRTCRVAYDLWEEVYRVKVSAVGVERDLAATNMERVIKICVDTVEKDATGVDQPTLIVADRSLLGTGKPHFVGVIMEVNPVSQDQIEQMRRWVTRPAGSTGIGPGDALFGSFVSFFMRQIGTADKTLRFRSQTFTP